MNLFENEFNSINLLPIDGEVYYIENFLNEKEQQFFFQALLKNIEWKADEVKIFGKHIITKRKMAWYANEEIEYTYSGISRKANLWNNELLALKSRIEKDFPDHFNACLLNLYHAGNEGMGWHSDNEKTIVENSAIASISLGAARKFSFKHKISDQTISLNLASGSLLLMKGETQKYWLHSLPKTTKVLEARINLTFRRMV